MDLRVKGHTDSDGGAAYDLDLSLRRANLHAAGLGLAKPVASNQTEAGKALNRRVELVRL